MKRNELDTVAWIQNHAGLDQGDIETLQPVLWFALLWNIFEVEICDRSASMKNIEVCAKKIIDSKNLIWNDFEEIWIRLKEILPQNVNNLSYYLLSNTISPSTRELECVEELHQSLESDKPISPSILHGMLFVAYRIRNNLFHGEKCITSLPRQLELFRTLNMLITRFIDAAKSIQRETLDLTEGGLRTGIQSS